MSDKQVGPKIVLKCLPCIHHVLIKDYISEADEVEYYHECQMLPKLNRRYNDNTPIECPFYPTHIKKVE